MAWRLSKEDIIKAIDSDYSNEKLKEILGSDSGSCIDFLPYLKTQQQISNFFTKQVPEKQNSEQETSINSKKAINTSKIASLFSKQVEKSKEETNGFTNDVTLVDDLQHKCAKCRANFEKQIDLENHNALAHEGRRQYTCTKCSATFANHTPLKNHIASVHEGKKQYQCNNCSATFVNHTPLKNHIVSVHEGKKQHECNNCSATFDNLFDSEYHISSVHEGKKQHNCNRYSANFEK